MTALYKLQNPRRGKGTFMCKLTHTHTHSESFNILAHINVQIRHSRGRWIWGQIVSDMLISIPSLKLGASAIKVMGHRQNHQPPSLSLQTVSLPVSFSFFLTFCSSPIFFPQLLASIFTGHNFNIDTMRKNCHIFIDTVLYNIISAV